MLQTKIVCIVQYKVLICRRLQEFSRSQAGVNWCKSDGKPSVEVAWAEEAALDLSCP